MTYTWVIESPGVRRLEGTLMTIKYDSVNDRLVLCRGTRAIHDQPITKLLVLQDLEYAIAYCDMGLEP